MLHTHTGKTLLSPGSGPIQSPHVSHRRMKKARDSKGPSNLNTFIVWPKVYSHLSSGSSAVFWS